MAEDCDGEDDDYGLEVVVIAATNRLDRLDKVGVSHSLGALHSKCPPLSTFFVRMSLLHLVFLLLLFPAHTHSHTHTHSHILTYTQYLSRIKLQTSIHQALLRPGRFDAIVEVPPPSSSTDIAAILRAHTLHRDVPHVAGIEESICDLSREIATRERERKKRRTGEENQISTTMPDGDKVTVPLSGARVAECCRSAVVSALREGILRAKRGRARRTNGERQKGKVWVDNEGERGEMEPGNDVYLEGRHLWEAARRMGLI